MRDFVYGDLAHLAVMRRRRAWFERLDLYLVLWWVNAGHRPTVTEAEQRLEYLRRHGPTPRAFTFRHHFDGPDDDVERVHDRSALSRLTRQHRPAELVTLPRAKPRPAAMLTVEFGRYRKSDGAAGDRRLTTALAPVLAAGWNRS
jgi:hypothetical protein